MQSRDERATVTNDGRFKPGQSGNPGGRCAKKITVTRDGVEIETTVQALAQEETERALQALVAVATTSRSDAARVSAATALLDRGWGKPAQMIVGDPENPIPIAGVTLADVLAAREQVVDEC